MPTRNGTATPKPGIRSFKLDELREQAAEALGCDPGYRVELDEGQPIFIPHPMFLDDTMQEGVDDADGAVDLARAVLGEAEHKRFLAAGGRSNDVALAWAHMRKQIEGVVPETKTPTQSST